MSEPINIKAEADAIAKQYIGVGGDVVGRINRCSSAIVSLCERVQEEQHNDIVQAIRGMRPYFVRY